MRRKLAAKWKGTGNWPFNTAYAGFDSSIRGCVGCPPEGPVTALTQCSAGAEGIGHFIWALYLVAHTKRHAVVRRKRHLPSRPERAPQAMAPLKRRARAAKKLELLADEKPVKAEELAAEAVIKPEEVEVAPVRVAAEGEEPLVPRERERGSYDGDTAIKLYLREIGQVKLLTPDEEITLAARIKRGDKKAREQMIKANLRLVVKIARDYEGIGLPR